MFRETENNTMILFASTSIILLLVVAIVTYALVHQKKIVQLRMRLHEEELRKQQAIFDALQEGQEKERTRLAQELHDGVGAKLSGLKMTMEYLNANVKEHGALISKVFSGLTETLEEVREISHNLQPYFFNNSIEQLLLDLIERHNATGDCSYSLSMSPLERELDEHLKLHIYRIISELLNNIRKHAQANQASVQINMEADAMTITVEDNGIGMHDGYHNLESIGLKNIRTRVIACKGNINIDSSEKGTIIIIEIPIIPIA
jgi:two-component system, NarL family, sensor kinase